MISLLIAVIVFGLLFWLLAKLPLTDPFMTAAQVILVIIAIIYFAKYLPAHI